MHDVLGIYSLSFAHCCGFVAWILHFLQGEAPKFFSDANEILDLEALVCQKAPWVEYLLLSLPHWNQWIKGKV